MKIEKCWEKLDRANSVRKNTVIIAKQNLTSWIKLVTGKKTAGHGTPKKIHDIGFT